MKLNPTEEQQSIITAAVEWKHDGALIINAFAGTGKEQPVSCIVKTPLGDELLGNIKVGDKVIGKDGNAVDVLGVFPQGRKEVYEVVFRDGAKTRCGIDHNWAINTISMRNRTEYRTMTLRDMLQFGIKKRNGGYKMKVPLCSPVNYSTKDFLLHPYVLGAFLGDGTFTCSTPALSYCRGDEYILIKCIEHLNEETGKSFENKSRRTSANGFQSTLTYKRDNTTNILSKILKDMGLHKEKHLPKSYLLGDVNQRLALLRGLMDTDGSICKNRVSFYNTNRNIIEGVKELVQGLGGTCIERKPDVRAGRTTTFSLNVKMFINPFSIARKASKWKVSTENPPSRYITSINLLPTLEEQVCIKVAARDSLYLTDEYIVTHNTSSLSLVAESLPERSLLMVFNRAAKEDAEKRFPNHVEVCTTHSLAYAVFGRKYQHKLSRPRGSYVNVVFTGGEIARQFRIKPIQKDDGKWITSAYQGILVRTTVEKFEQSADNVVKWQHIPAIVNKLGIRDLIFKLAKRLWAL